MSPSEVKENTEEKVQYLPDGRSGNATPLAALKPQAHADVEKEINSTSSHESSSTTASGLPVQVVQLVGATEADDDDGSVPPPLPYNLRDHKLGIIIFWFLILAECCFVPVSFYYGLFFGTDLNHGALFAIITSVFGFVSAYEYLFRAYLLLLPRDEYRPLNNSARFWGFDSLHWILAIPYTVLTAVLIGGSIPGEPLTRILAMPMALANIILGVMFIISGVATTKRWKLPCRFSSHLKGDVCPPITFNIIEDVVAVDGRGGKVYRIALMKRYQASPRFRLLLLRLVWFWGIPSIVVGSVLLALIFTVKKEVAYGLGWSIPNIWAGFWALITTVYVKRSLKAEKRNWVVERRPPA